MRNSMIPVCLAVLAFATQHVCAIDRSVDMIDTIGVEAAVYDGADSVTLSLWGENAFAAPNQNWAIMAGGGVGALSTDEAGDAGFLYGGVGVKYYATKLTSLTLLGRYCMYDAGGEPGLAGASLALKQRLVSATEPISPFFIFSGLIQADKELESDDGLDEYDLPNVILKAQAGVDFMMHDTLAFVFEGGVLKTEDEGYGNFRMVDGWGGFVALSMQYYWDQDHL